MDNFKFSSNSNISSTLLIRNKVQLCKPRALLYKDVQNIFSATFSIFYRGWNKTILLEQSASGKVWLVEVIYLKKCLSYSWKFIIFLLILRQYFISTIHIKGILQRELYCWVHESTNFAFICTNFYLWKCIFNTVIYLYWTNI